MIEWLVEHWMEIMTLLGSALTAWAHGRRSGRRAALREDLTEIPTLIERPRKRTGGMAVVVVMIWIASLGAIVAIVGGLMGCGASWSKSARASVDAVSRSTTAAWREYVIEAQQRCKAAAVSCAEREVELKACVGYESCRAEARDVGQAVIGLHEAVERARRILDELDREDIPAVRTQAFGAWRLVLRSAAAIADRLAREPAIEVLP